MKHTLIWWHARITRVRYMWSGETVAVLLALLMFVDPASAAMRFQERGLTMQSAVPGATTSYTLGFRYMSPQAVGSVDMLFCMDPIPYHPCVAPPGLDVSSAMLSSQTGEVGYSIQSQSANHIVLTRVPTIIMAPESSYKFDNVVNPTDTTTAFSIRLRSHASTDATGPQIDFGSVRGQVTSSINIETQVPPMLIFCVAEEVEENCTNTNDNNYSDMGQLNANSTLTAQSQMAVGTNATAGFAIIANGTSMAAGTSVIDSPTAPTQSTPGSNQFGINLVANDSPSVGADPEGIWANALPTPDYSEPNKYKYVPGDVVASSPNVSLMKKFTVSYVLNADKNLRAGVYTTTITYIASGQF